MRNRWLKGSLLLVVGLLALVGWSGSARAAGIGVTPPSYVATFQIPVVPLSPSLFHFNNEDGSTITPCNLDDTHSDSVAPLTPGDKGTNYVQEDVVALNLKNGALYFLLTTNNKFSAEGWFHVNDSTVLIPGMDEPKVKPATHTDTFNVNFLDESGKDIASVNNESVSLNYLPTDAVTGDPLIGLTDSLKQTDANGKLVTSREIEGYTLAAKDPLTVDGPVVDGNTTTYNYTYHYTKNITGGNTNTGTNTSGIAGTSRTATMPTTDSSSSAASQATTTKAPVQRKAVYAVKKIGLYSQPTFTKQNRTRWFTKQTRPNRPTFTVIGYARSKAVNLRYKVRTADGTTGYITTRSAYVTNAYYQHKPAQVKVISAKGLNAYGNVALNVQKLRHYKRGSVLKIKAIKTHGLTTRLVLTNGRYITGNKTFVIAK